MEGNFMQAASLHTNGIMTCLQHFTDALWEIDITKKTVHIFYHSAVPELENTNMNYSEFYALYINQYLYSGDIEKWNAFFSLNSLMLCAENKEKPKSFDIRIRTSSGYKWNEIYYYFEENKVIVTSKILNKIKDFTIPETTAVFQKQYLQYLDDIPIAFCTIRVDVDAQNHPYDFVFTYLNKALALLGGTTREALLFSSFYDFFPDGDKKWLNIYYKTAYEGIPQEFTAYSPEINKHLAISTYQPEYGYCGCILRDITNEVLLEIEIEKSYERAKLILENTTDAVFQFDLETRTIYSSKYSILKNHTLPEISNVPYGLLEKGFISKEGISSINQALSLIENGENSSSCEIKARVNKNLNFSWYNITLSAYQEIHTGKRCVLGFLKNINAIVQQREKLEKAACSDPLTKLYNVAAGKMLIENILMMQNNGNIQNAFLLFDLDNFKQINDSYGHTKGDDILTEFASILKNNFSSKDIIYRLGGDEFAVFIENIEHISCIKYIILKIFSQLDKASKKGISVSTSIGVFVGNAYHKFENYYKNADIALYQAKKAGRHTYHIIEKAYSLSQKAL